MSLEPYFELLTRNGKLTTILMIGIKRIDTDNLGSSDYNSGSFFPRIFIYYINDKVLKIDFSDGAIEEAKLAYENIERISELNMKYIVENKMLDQFFKI